jgi:hypothetical protein
MWNGEKSVTRDGRREKGGEFLRHERGRKRREIYTGIFLAGAGGSWR